MKRLIIDAVVNDDLAHTITQHCATQNVPYTCDDYEPPRVVLIICEVTNNRTPGGTVIATATLPDGEPVRSLSAPTGERALAALGLNTPTAHAHQLYRRRWGRNYKLVTREEYELAKQAQGQEPEQNPIEETTMIESDDFDLDLGTDDEVKDANEATSDPFAI